MALRWLLRALFLLLRAAPLALVPLLLSALAYGLYSQSAAQLLVQQLPQLTDGALRIGKLQGPLAGPLVIKDLVYDSDGVRVDLSQARVEWNLLALVFRGLEIRALDAGTLRVTLKPTPPTPPEDALTHLPFALKLEDAKLQRFELFRDHAETLVFDAVQLRGEWIGDTLRLPQAALRYAPLGGVQLDAQLRFEPRALNLVDVALNAPAPIQLQGRIGYDDDSFRMEGHWRALQWPLQGEAQVSSAQGQLRAEGRWDDYAYRLNADLLTQQLPVKVAAEGRGSLDALDLHTLRAELLGGHLAAAGRVAWSPQLKAEMQGQIEDLDPGQRWADWPGRIGGQFSLSSSGASATAFSLALKDSQLRAYPLTLDAQGELRDERVKLARFDLASGASRLRARGVATPPFALTLDLDSRDLASLWPGLQGKARVSASVEGTMEQPHVVTQGEFTTLRYADTAVAAATLSADLHPRKPSHLEVLARGLDVGTRIDEARLRADGTLAQQVLRLQAKTPQAEVGIGLRGGVDAALQRWQGELFEGRGAPLQLPAWTLEEPAVLTLTRDGSVALEPACWSTAPGGSGRACAQLRHRGNVSRLAFRLEDWSFAYFAGFMPPQWKFTGAASGTGVIEVGDGGIREARADVQTTAGRLNVGKQLALSFEPSSLRIAEESKGLTLLLRVPVQGGAIDVDALLGAAATPAQRPLSGRVHIALDDLTPLRLLSPELESIAGRLEGDFTLSGNAERPRSAGALKLVGASARLATPGILLDPLQAELRTRADSSVMELHASATSGGGTLTLQGQTDPQSDGKLLDLHISGDNFHALNMPDVHLWVSPDVKLELSRERADLSGEVRVPHAEIQPRSLSQGVSPSRDQILLGPDGEAEGEGLLKVHSKLRIVLGDNVRFDGFGLKAQLAGALDAYDEPGRPTQARGEIRLVEGRYKAYGQDLTIETGRLLFNGGAITDPAIELRAVRRPDDNIAVGIYARGTLASPEFSLYSTPDMPQDQQLSWLVLGRGIDETATPGERSAMSSAALSLGLSGGSFLSQKFGSSLSLDEVSIGARPGQTSDQAQFTIGKYLSPKLFISYGIGVFQPGHTFRLLYDIGKHFKLSTESGIESGGDLLYTIER